MINEDEPDKGDKQAVAAFISRVDRFPQACPRIWAAYQELGDTEAAEQRIRQVINKVAEQMERKAGGEQIEGEQERDNWKQMNWK